MESSNISRCYQCAKPANQVCGICKIATYCSKECQRTQWTDHKSQCNNDISNLTQSIVDSESKFRNILTPSILNLMAGYSKFMQTTYKRTGYNIFSIYDASSSRDLSLDGRSYMIRPFIYFDTSNDEIIFMLNNSTFVTREMRYRAVVPEYQDAMRLFRCGQNWKAIWMSESHKLKIIYVDDKDNAIAGTAEITVNITD